MVLLRQNCAINMLERNRTWERTKNREVSGAQEVLEVSRFMLLKDFLGNGLDEKIYI